MLLVVVGVGHRIQHPPPSQRTGVALLSALCSAVMSTLHIMLLVVAGVGLSDLYHIASMHPPPSQRAEVAELSAYAAP